MTTGKKVHARSWPETNRDPPTKMLRAEGDVTCDRDCDPTTYNQGVKKGFQPSKRNDNADPGVGLHQKVLESSTRRS